MKIALLFKILVWPDGRSLGNAGGGELENRIREAAQKALSKGAAKTMHYSLREVGDQEAIRQKP
jgi:xanthine/CO dehydrogenase XdhC/CoxF family maturation factor